MPEEEVEEVEEEDQDQEDTSAFIFGVLSAFII